MSFCFFPWPLGQVLFQNLAFFFVFTFLIVIPGLVRNLSFAFKKNRPWNEFRVTKNEIQLPWDCHGCKKRSLAVAQLSAIAHSFPCLWQVEHLLRPKQSQHLPFIPCFFLRHSVFSLAVLNLFQHLIFCFYLFRGSIEGVLFNPLKLKDPEINSGWQKKKIGVRGKCVPSKLKTLKRVQGDKRIKSFCAFLLSCCFFPWLLYAKSCFSISLLPFCLFNRS